MTTPHLDNMSDLLLNHHLRTAKTGDEASEVARERTLTTLRRLDANRNKIVLQFLHDANLIGINMNSNVIDLSHAALFNDDLNDTNLSGALLVQADLSKSGLIPKFTPVRELLARFAQQGKVAGISHPN